MELKHFAHKHPLTLIEDEDDFQYNCYFCEETISGPRFKCRVCYTFVLHISCAELPEEMSHFRHPEHPLTLSFGPYRYKCDACCKSGDDFGHRGGFVYLCSPCEFYLDIGCAQLPQTIQHIVHQHPLTIQLKKALFCCDACGIRHEEEGFSYMCFTCHFWLHESCISLHSSIECASHNHPLTLVNSFQLEAFEELSRFDIYYDICTKKVKRKNCLYYCLGCRYFAHVGCCTSSETKNTSNMIAEDQSPNLICLPEPSSVDLVNRLIEQISLGSNKRSTDQLKHCNCENHNLTLFDAQTDEICEACLRPISAPYYNCPECHLILHKSCAELPNEMHHPLHTQHTLTLKKLTEGLDFYCTGCDYRKYSDKGFYYSCEPCSFSVDIKCASLPTTIRHETHKHHLNLQQNFEPMSCNACYEDVKYWFTFKCSNTCNFNLHNECALLPRTLRHRYDKHDLILTYSPAGIKSKEYYCEICEEELNPKFWFYYCADCDYAFHTKCISKDHL